MMLFRCAILLALFCSGLPLQAQVDALKDTKEKDDSLLKSAGVKLDGANLVDFLKKRSEKTIDAEAVKPVLEKLKSEAQADRDQAMGEILKWGQLAKPLIAKTMGTVSNKDVLAQMKRCLSLIDNAELPVAVVRSMARLKPEGGVKAMLQFLPYSEEGEVREELTGAISYLSAGSDGAGADLVAALKDENPLRRGVAASMICRIGSHEQVKALKPLLKDPKPTVRLKVALGLADRYEPEAIATLIELLDELPVEQRDTCLSKLSDVAGQWKVELPRGNDPISRQLRAQLWESWWKALDPDMLTKEIQKWTPSSTEREKIQSLIKQLASAMPAEKESATTALRELGLKAIPLLRGAAEKETPEGAAANRLLQSMGEEVPNPLPASIVRILAYKNDPGSVAVLMEYLPYASNPEVREVIEQAVPWLAAREESTWPLLIKALEDPLQDRRFLAARALAHIPQKREVARELLSSKDPNVRFTTAFALAGEQDKQAVSTMISLIGEGTSAQAERVVTYLSELNAPNKPKVSLGTTPAERQAASKAWAEWWQANRDAVTLIPAHYRSRVLGYTFIVESYNSNLRGGRVMELDRNGKVRWQITGLQYPYHAEVIRNNRVLICEQNTNRVTERDFKGKILWNFNCTNPRYATRLSNGKTMVAYQNQLVEVDQNGKVTGRRQLPDQIHVYGARYMKNGDFAYISTSYVYRRIDKNGKVVQSLTVPVSPVGGSRYPMITKKGTILVSYYSERKVKEYDEKGKLLQEIPNADRPYCPTLTSRGNVLISSTNLHKVVELTPKGKKVRDLGNNIYPFKAFER